ncbi:T6SS immunity protein Tli4 family protein [Massilia brevitalea]|uniref:T6SS immunity protein Tli4 family protein n=1 Tax=Massilia brevitalea TaxID=442526 RepID=UPI00273884B0|nr:T6SS immunity protein Tli4 family protein [Massilia brevitalea]
MRLLIKPGKWLLVLGAVFAILFIRSKAVQSEQDIRAAASMTEKMRTVCIGRFLIDVPANANFNLKAANLDGFDVAWQEETAEQFGHFVNERESKLGSGLNMLGQNNIESNETIQESNILGKVFVHGRYRGYEIRGEQRVYFETVTIEAHINKNGVTYSFNSEGDGPERVVVVRSLMRQLVNTRGTSLPNVAGFCLDGAIIADPADSKRHESAMISGTLPGYPDIVLALSMNTGRHRGPGLIERDMAATDMVTRARSRVLRSQARTIAGLSGEEVGVRTTELNFSTNFSFAWETNGSEDDFQRPRLSLEFDTGVNPRSGGEPVQSSLDEEAVLRLWDKISSSIRLRRAEVPPRTPMKVQLDTPRRLVSASEQGEH